MRAIYGPPGTGKTHTLTKEITSQISLTGVDTVLAITYTRAAAAELASRTLLPKTQARTLHSLAFNLYLNSCGEPPKLDVDVKPGEGQTWEEWVNAERPHYNSTWVQPTDSNEPWAGRNLASQAEKYRGLLAPEEDWPIEALEWYEARLEWYEANGITDYTGLIEYCIVNNLTPAQQYIWVDEAQDLTVAEAGLIEMWELAGKTICLVGDDDQTLYEFRGADPKVTFSHVTESATLPKSHRCPQKITDAAQQWISQCEWRIPKTWEPRPEPGEIDAYTVGAWDIQKIIPKIDLTETTMILASNGWTLQLWATEMRAAGMRHGLPGSDRWTSTVGVSNDGVHGAMRCWAGGVQRGDWHPPEAVKILNIIGKDYLKYPKTKTAEEIRNLRTRLTPEVICARMLNNVTPEQICDPNEYLKLIVKSHQTAARHPIDICITQGLQAWLAPTAPIWPTTIHGAKGLQADHVILDLRIGVQRTREWRKHHSDDMIRRYYVALTRAKRKLTLLEGAAKESITLKEILGRC